MCTRCVCQNNITLLRAQRSRRIFPTCLWHPSTMISFCCGEVLAKTISVWYFRMSSSCSAVRSFRSPPCTTHALASLLGIKRHFTNSKSIIKRDLITHNRFTEQFPGFSDQVKTWRVGPRRDLGVLRIQFYSVFVHDIVHSILITLG